MKDVCKYCKRDIKRNDGSLKKTYPWKHCLYNEVFCFAGANYHAAEPLVAAPLPRELADQVLRRVL